MTILVTIPHYLHHSARAAIAGLKVLVSRRRLSRSVPIEVLQQTTEALPAPDLAIDSANFVARFEETVFETLVVSAPMVAVEIRGTIQQGGTLTVCH